MGKIFKEEGNTCLHVTDSLCCIAETSNIVKQVYSNKKMFYKINKKRDYAKHLHSLNYH